MVNRLSPLLWQSVVLLWTVFTVVTLAVISVLILRVPHFPLGITFVSTRGIAGLWITVPAFLSGIAGLILMLFRRISGARCLLLYSAFWTASTSYGVFENLYTVVRQPLHVCLTGTCATLPVTLAILVAFVLSLVWFWRKSFARVA
ncbi:MAG TPA: hypothetical protein VME18_06195 [Acidobacteriaceae bacterium]|nr:hypothetical protein [Acidobacteriaceae bacterium]